MNYDEMKVTYLKLLGKYKKLEKENQQLRQQIYGFSTLENAGEAKVQDAVAEINE